jgi:hypothetical protein
VKTLRAPMSENEKLVVILATAIGFGLAAVLAILM